MGNNALPIGIIDSGIGGLTVAESIKDILPNESFVFFGDTAHVPYGDKSANAIRYYTDKIIRYLLKEFQCKAIVVACNTASAIAGQNLVREDYNVPVINVIDPVVEYVLNELHLKRIGVIGTKRTIESRAYPKRIKKIAPDAKVVSKATPLLAPMIEEGFFNNNISKTIIHEYLSWKQFDQVECIILGCTHYPHIKKEVEGFFQNRAVVVEGGRVVAEQLKNTLKDNNLLQHGRPGITAKNRFLVSDFTSSFEKATQIFFGRRVELEESPLWNV